jgi:hypothetical protein
MLTTFQLNIPQDIINHIETNRHFLTQDVSNYAKGRYRAWIGLEAPLTNNHTFVEAPFTYKDKLWLWLRDFCIENINFEPEIALLHVGGANCSNPEDKPINGGGGECGITLHRDAAYADYRAVGINLKGEATFGYKDCYGVQDRWVREQNPNAETEWVKMVAGTTIVFNCKNPHFAQVGPNRWAINAWRISDKRRLEWEILKYKLLN